MDVVELHNRTVDHFARLVDEVGPDQWSMPTPDTDWDVRALVNHVVGEERWTVPLMEGKTIADVGDSLDGDLLGDDPVAATSQRHARPEVAAARTIAKVHLSYGDEDPDEYLRQLAADHLIHGWDLAAAIGAEIRLDPELVGEVAGGSRSGKRSTGRPARSPSGSKVSPTRRTNCSEPSAAIRAGRPSSPLEGLGVAGGRRVVRVGPQGTDEQAGLGLGHAGFRRRPVRSPGGGHRRPSACGCARPGSRPAGGRPAYRWWAARSGRAGCRRPCLSRASGPGRSGHGSA